MSDATPTAEFLQRVETSLADGSFSRLTFGKYRGRDAELERITVRRVVIQGEDQVSFVSRYHTRDVTKNFAPADTAVEIRRQLEAGFRSATLITSTEELQLLCNKRGEARLLPGRHQPPATRSPRHDRAKARLLDPDRPFLRHLGVTDDRGRVLPSMAAKWKQINRFLEVFARDFAASNLADRPGVRVVDFGCGKGYLTFAVHDWLTRQQGRSAEVTGIELRSELAEAGNRISVACGCDGLSFHAGNIAHFPAATMDVMIALHACDTATDLALHTGIRNGARLLMCAPCCHKEIRPQVHIPDVLRPMLRHGIHLGAEADMLTDSMRALLLEAEGYDVKVFEFISLEHTSKNRMITAVKNERSRRVNPAREELARLKEYYGVREQRLESLLTASAAA